MKPNTQILKGLLEGCILRLINADETYGYKICEDLEKGGFNDIGEGTVYPILIRLEKKNYINSTSKKSPLGPKRKYFSITKEGKKYLDAFSEEWKSIQSAIDNFF